MKGVTVRMQRNHHRRKDGSIIDVEITAHPIAFEGRAARLVLATDITERRQLEEQLRQAQRMEAVGRLAGGVAHDFNNILTAILGYGDVLGTRLAPDDPRRADLEQILEAASRATELTRQLLAFGRKQVLQPVAIDLNHLVEKLHGMLRRLLGAHVELTTSPAPELGRVRADAGQIEQVIVNLAVNARDAMPGGGKLTIETRNVELDLDSGLGVPAGPYVQLAVSDTGSGIDARIRAHIFEPFYTTKSVGKGTGLGLATVHGIVQQSGGAISVYSEPGRGSTFKIYLPRVADEPLVTPTSVARLAASTGSETVLLVEDDAPVRDLSRRALESRGYRVLVASDGAEGLRVAQAHAGAIDLLVSDVVMPVAGGPELAGNLRPLRPGLRVLFLSGYADTAFARSGELTREAAFLQKPFTPERLAQKVREVLDERVSARR
jgi:signal transduction histidine kinase/ActR/RegA family two-component response regulator